MHAPKISSYDLVAKTHTVSKGTFSCERLEVMDGWLLVERPMVDHSDFFALSSYMLPDLGIAVTRWQNRPESDQNWYDYYVDILACEVEGELWTTRDFYLDGLVVEGKLALTNDTDEYLEAVREGLLTETEAASALTKMHTLLNGLGECGYSMKAWLKHEVGLEMAF